MSLIASSDGQLFRVVEHQGLPQSGLAAFAIDLINSCLEISRPHQHGIASKKAQVAKTNINIGKSAMLMGCVQLRIPTL